MYGTCQIVFDILYFPSTSTIYPFLIHFEFCMLNLFGLHQWILYYLWLPFRFSQCMSYQEIRGGDKKEFRIFVFLVPSLQEYGLAVIVLLYLRPQVLYGNPFSLTPTVFISGYFFFFVLSLHPAYTLGLTLFNYFSWAFVFLPRTLPVCVGA